MMLMMSINTITVNAITVIKTTAKNAVDNAFRALFLLLSLAGALLLFSCNQDDIFYRVENETELKDPLIQGGPTKIVEFKNALYVASAKIWKYERGSYERGSWSQLPGQPGGVKVMDLAATKKYLYAVISKDDNLSDTEYWRGIDSGSGVITWNQIPVPAGHPGPSAIYGAGDTLFVGTPSNAVYALKDDGTGGFGTSISVTGMLQGAAWLGSDYYISLSGQGVFKSANSTAAITDSDLIPGSRDRGDFTGMVVDVVDNSLIMVSTLGVICKLSGADTTIDEKNSYSSNGFPFTGAIAVWNDPAAPADSSKRRLLLGRGGRSSQDYGYWEYTIPEIKPGEGIIIDRRDPEVTVESNPTYRNSLGKRAINSIYQVPASIDPSMPIFASTEKDSLWVCSKSDKDGWAWNRQE
jgi:hypothetical protein